VGGGRKRKGEGGEVEVVQRDGGAAAGKAPVTAFLLLHLI